uniref:Uncharacterized protein n=1 Tax=Meloidogyne enterolobii TaxID=390850 RepID=A0A6V7VJL1_MELEN|nr:unnamed protein product [Meloidogyne enterolobii]
MVIKARKIMVNVKIEEKLKEKRRDCVLIILSISELICEYVRKCVLSILNNFVAKCV